MKGIARTRLKSDAQAEINQQVQQQAQGLEANQRAQNLKAGVFVWRPR